MYLDRRDVRINMAQILNRFTNEIMFEDEKKFIKQLCEENKVNLNGANLNRADLEWADLAVANLNRADLEWADLEGADLEGADFRGANLKWANLNRADLEGADFRGADLEGANLEGANLEGVNLDYSVLFFGCKSFNPKTDQRQRIQLLFHWAQWVINSDNATKKELKCVNRMLKYLNQFHRGDVDRIEKIIINYKGCNKKIKKSLKKGKHIRCWCWDDDMDEKKDCLVVGYMAGINLRYVTGLSGQFRYARPIKDE